MKLPDWASLPDWSGYNVAVDATSLRHTGDRVVRVLVSAERGMAISTPSMKGAGVLLVWTM